MHQNLINKLERRQREPQHLKDYQTSFRYIYLYRKEHGRQLIYTQQPVGVQNGASHTPLAEEILNEDTIGLENYC